ncbi:MAG: hypothetical protein HY653_03620 [Acidobacteria bacterium]|nr:hypothetical protein [Acidobacteriota bacterium]
MGTVIAQQTVPAPGDFWEGWLYDLRVEKTFRGPTHKTIRVFTENDSGRFLLEMGRQYLLFATEFENQLQIDNCGNSALISEAEDIIRQIEKIQKASDGEISGRVARQSDLSAAVPGVHIIIRGENKRYVTLTEQDGSFHIDVPLGKYTIHAESSLWTLFPYDLSYDDPSDTLVHKGGCAQVQFVAVPK